MNDENVNIARTITALFGGILPMSRALGHKNPSTVQGWCQTGVIPVRWKKDVETAAAKAEVSIPKTWWLKMHGLYDLVAR
jgi:hypothetical protein